MGGDRTRGSADVVVVGGGPAGAAVARCCAAEGLGVTVVDPDPTAPWPASYGAWADELPPDLPADLVAGTMTPARVVGSDGAVRTLDRDYVMLSTRALQRHLQDVEVASAAGRAVGLRRDGDRTEVVLAGGGTVAGRIVVDASGPRRVLTGGPAPPPRAAQTAFGVVVGEERLSHLPHGSALAFMDWRQDHGHGGWPTFLYAVPLGGGRVLLEETSLARRPGLPLDELRSRLHDRLDARRVTAGPDAPEEQVAFAVDTPISRGGPTTVAFGAAAPLVHPATGYSLAAALRLAPAVADAVASSLHRGPEAAADAARAAIWPAPARLVHHLRRRGLEVVLALPPQRVGPFFDLFFSLPTHHQRAYLSEREDPLPVMTAMAALFRAADPALRRHLLRWGPPLRRAVAVGMAR